MGHSEAVLSCGRSSPNKRHSPAPSLFRLFVILIYRSDPREMLSALAGQLIASETSRSDWADGWGEMT
jgi:hypothetical protein